MSPLTRIFEPAGGVLALRHLPAMLTVSRLALVPVMLANAYLMQSRAVFVMCLAWALVSDIYDGVIARRLRIDTPALRRFDSGTDVAFWVCTFWCVWVVQPGLVHQFRWALGGLAVLEVMCNTISLFKYHRPPATHTYSAKTWGILLFASLVAILGFGYDGWLMVAMIVVGYIANVEVLAIMWISRDQPVDVAGVWKVVGV